jgi:hypothetical protein
VQGHWQQGKKHAITPHEYFDIITFFVFNNLLNQTNNSAENKLHFTQLLQF